MSRGVYWTCDRCGTSVDVAESIVFYEEYTPAADGHLNEGLPDKWERFYSDAGVKDACPACVTPVEVAERIFREVEAEAADPFFRDAPERRLGTE